MPARYREIHDAAVNLFLRQGYARTRVAHIAKAVGVSPAMIYYDFDGKEEIRDFVLKCTIDPDFINGEFIRPIGKRMFTGLEDEIIATLNRTANEFSQNLETGTDGYRFEELISDAFDLLAKYAVGCLYIEKNMHDCGALADSYIDYRKRFFHTMTGYLQGFMEQGVLRPLEDLELVTTMIIEILTWWAMDMRYIAFDDNRISLEKAKTLCMDNITHAYQL